MPQRDGLSTSWLALWLGLALAGCGSDQATQSPAADAATPESTPAGPTDAARAVDAGTNSAPAESGSPFDATTDIPPVEAGPEVDAASPPTDVSPKDASTPLDAPSTGSPPDAAAMTNSSPDAGSSAAFPPTTDKTSTLGISSPPAGYHVEGNIPYGPYVMQRLDVLYPNGAGPNGTTKLPGVIMFHGGGWTDDKPSSLKASMSSFFNRFLAHGFLVCNVEYRLGDGPPNGAIAPAADEDALLAAKWFWDYMDHYHVDKTRYVVTGASAGGQLALMVGMATPAAGLGPTSPTDYKIAAIVNGYGPSDVTDLLAKNVSWAVQWLPVGTPNRAAIATQVSAITYVRKDIPPLITVQGQDDTTVPTAESQNLYNLLTAAGADTSLHFVAGAGHGFDTPATAWPDAEQTMFAFLTAHGLP